MKLGERVTAEFKRDPRIRVLFLFDEEGELKEELDSLELPDVKVEVFSGNAFRLKVALHKAANARTLVYCKQRTPKSTDQTPFPLLDILTANRELRLDDVGSFLEEFGLVGSRFETVARPYMALLKQENVQRVLKPLLNELDFEEEAVKRGIISYFLKAKEPQNWDVIVARTIMLANDGPALTRFHTDLEKAGLFQDLLAKMAIYFSEPTIELTTQNLQESIRKLKYNAILRGVPESPKDPYKQLRITNSAAMTRLSRLIETAGHHALLSGFMELLEEEKTVQEEKLMDTYGASAAFSWMPRAMKRKLIAHHIHEAVHKGNGTGALSGLESLSLMHEDDVNLKSAITATILALTCLADIKKLPVPTSTIAPEEHLATYVSSGYKVDTHYRNALSRFTQLDQAAIPDFASLEELLNELHAAYNSWVDGANRAWLQSLSSIDFDYQKLQVPKQYEFFEKQVADYPHKLVVIISDALRYEAAMELLAEMNADPKAEVRPGYALASIPSKTSVGMSNLLPAKHRSFDGDNIQLDGKLVASTQNRQDLLQTKVGGAVAVNFDKVRGLAQSDARELFKSPLVYIYHNTIDATGDDRKTEGKTFQAVDDAIKELSRFIRNIHASYNVARVLLTADHGFLYTGKPVDEASKEDALPGNPAIQHNRFAVFNNAVNPPLGYALPLKATTKFDDDAWVVIPASINRYKRQGAGHQFVHGGGSLQELVVPVLQSVRKREDVLRKVGVRPMFTDLRVVSSVFKVDLLQTTAVSATEKALSLRCGLYEGSTLVSDQKDVNLASTSELPTERLYPLMLTLKSGASNSSVLAFKAYDTDDALNSLIDLPVKNITLIDADF